MVYLALLLFVILLHSTVPSWANTVGKLNGLSLTFRLALTRFLLTCSISIRHLLQIDSLSGVSEMVSLLLLQVVNLVFPSAQ